MGFEIRPYRSADAEPAAAIWNEVVEDGVAFPQTECLAPAQADRFFSGQSYTGVAFMPETGELLGLYILHPNNIGRCGHICNASYAVKRSARGRGVGESLVTHCKAQGKTLGFRILQFNAVVRSNERALRLYQKLGFTQLGVVPGGFLLKNGHYEDIILYYCAL